MSDALGECSEAGYNRGGKFTIRQSPTGVKQTSAIREWSKIMHNIRAARPSDAPTIVDFNCRMAWETERKRLDPTKITPGVAAVLERPELGRYFVAEVADGGPPEVIGQLMITYEWSDWRNGLFWWIQSVYVREDARSRGVFRALYEHVEKLARADAGSCGLRLYVEHANERAQRVYRKLGMQPSDYVFYELDWSATK